MERTTKMIACCLLIFFTYGSAYAQDVYYVTFVKGDVKKSNAAKVKVGDKLLFQESVTFSTKDCRLILLHPQKGRFVVEPGNVTKQPSGEYLGYLKNNLIPNFKKVNLSTRGFTNLESYFRADPTINENLLFIGDSRISVDTSKYRMTDAANDFFFLQYTTDSGKNIINKLLVKQDTLFIRKTDLLFDGAPLPDNAEISIGFVQNYSIKKRITDIASFKQVFMSLAECKKIMKTIKKALGKNREMVIDETFTQLYNNYGKPDKKILGAVYDGL